MRRIANLHARAQRSTKKCHQQRCGHSLSYGVRYGDADLVIEYLDPIVIVAGYLFGRKDVCADVEILELRIVIRKKLKLNLTGNFELGLDPFFLYDLVKQPDLLD